MIIMLLLHVIHTGMRHRIQPFTHHVVHITACTPITLITIIRAEDNEEGYRGDKDPDSVRVCGVFFGNVVCFEEQVDPDGNKGWEGGPPERGSIYAE